ncbi:hypothetical protein BDP81DRAFT_433471 [Colletotrichum phormii]|uniref:Uncharacterized protein n=1 Tax=Colletotrichum phormii TaxID=359342 RepID=A0AAJ0ECG4_9PEZI|nr:uncharacterized protein BDP81DRAFT_433471 [Colletotrichum phormii]KAK1633969.1 hypothetical protein BDP81DRAFT_433471 [Colletotrichum phormii]
MMYSQCWGRFLPLITSKLLSRSRAVGPGWGFFLTNGGDNTGKAVSLLQARRISNASLIGCGRFPSHLYG